MPLAGVGTAVAALVVALFVVIAPAGASALTSTQIVSASVSPATISYPGPETVTVSGILETTGPAPEPLAGQQVLLSYTIGLGQYASTVETGSGGRFSGQVTLPAPAAIIAGFSATDGYASTSATVGVHPAQVYPAKIELDPINPGPIWSYRAITGTLLMQLPSGSWVPSPYALMEPTGTLFFTDANGRFSIPAEVIPGNPVTVTSESGFAWSGTATVGPFYMPLKPEPTWFCGPVGPDIPVSPVADVGFGIHVCYETASGGTINYSGLARLYFQPASGGSWRFMASTRTAADGSAHVTVSGYLPTRQLAAGRWKWVAPGSAQFAGSTSQPFAVVITVPTRIDEVNIRRRGRREYLDGRLGYLKHGGPIARARILVERRAGRHWRRAAILRTSDGGTFGYLLRGRPHGRYRAVYSGGHLPGAQAQYGSFERAVSGSVLFR